MRSNLIQPREPTFKARRQNGWISTTVSPTETPRIKAPDSPTMAIPRELFAEMLTTTRTVVRGGVLPAVKGAVDVTKSNHSDESKCADISLGVGASPLDKQMQRRNTSTRNRKGAGTNTKSMMHDVRIALSEQLHEHKLPPGRRQRLSSKNLVRTLEHIALIESQMHEGNFGLRRKQIITVRK